MLTQKSRGEATTRVPEALFIFHMSNLLKGFETISKKNNQTQRAHGTYRRQRLFDED
jgi:hypothetical protein